MPICYKLSSGGSGRSGSLVFSPEIWQPQRTEARLGRKHQQDKKTKRQKDKKTERACVVHTLLLPPTCCTFPFWLSLDTHGHTHFTPQSRDREEKRGGRLIKTLRAVLDLTGWVKHTEHRSLLMSTQTRTLTDVSIHLDCHTHTPPRDLTSSVSQLNYSSPSSCLSLFSFLSVSLTSVWETDSNKDTCLARCRSLAISNTKPVSEEEGHTYQMCCLMF